MGGGGRCGKGVGLDRNGSASRFNVQHFCLVVFSCQTELSGGETVRHSEGFG